METLFILAGRYTNGGQKKRTEGHSAHHTAPFLRNGCLFARLSLYCRRIVSADFSCLLLNAQPLGL